jgi:hypothetical protein
MTIASIVTPKWISYTEITKSGDTVYDHIGLHRRCMSTSPDGCVHFPDEQRCEDDGRFCNMWRTTGFLMSLAVVVDLATIVGFLVVVAGGKAKRETGWRVLCGMLGLVAALQFGATAVVVSLRLSCVQNHFHFADVVIRAMFSTTMTSSMFLVMRWMRRGISALRVVSFRPFAQLVW